MNITVIGAGNMGGALIHGWAKSGKLSSITISDKNEALLASFKEKYPSINITTDNVAAVKGADIVVVVVKPWLMPVVLDEIKYALDLDKQIVVSDAANFTTDKLAEQLGASGQFCYVIPNIAAEFGASMSFIAKGKSATDAALAQVKGLYDIVGDTLVVAENLVGPGMMMASCGIAYVMRYIRAQMEGGCEMGFYPAQAKQIALQTMQGAVSLLKETGWHPEEAIDKQKAKHKDKFTIVVVGRYSAEKAQQVLIKAVAKSKYKDRIHLILAGEGPKKRRYKHLAKKNGVDCEMRFFDHDELKEVLNAADLYVHTAYVELESIACLEAIVTGLVPIICNSERSAARFFAQDDRCLYHKWDSEDLKNKIEYFMDNPEELKACKRKYKKQANVSRLGDCMNKMEEMLVEAAGTRAKEA